MTENNALKMNLDHERKIVELQSRVNKLENLCYMTKEVLNLEEASAFLGIAKSTLYKMTHLNQHLIALQDTHSHNGTGQCRHIAQLTEHQNAQCTQQRS